MIMIRFGGGNNAMRLGVLRVGGLTASVNTVRGGGRSYLTGALLVLQRDPQG